MTKSQILITALIALVALGATGCASKPPKPTVAQVNLRAAPDLNPDISGEARPLRIRYYELKSVSAFTAADFFSLYDHDKEVLTADLVAREEIQVEPGMQQTITRKLDPGTKYIAVLAPYRDIEHATWRASLEVPPNATTPVTLQLDRLAVLLVAAPEPKGKK